MVAGLLGTSMSFFYRHSLGRLLSRFSKEIAVGDGILPVVLTYFLEAWARVFSILVYVCIVNPWLLLVSVVVFALGFLIRNKLLSVQTQVMNLELQSRGPLTSYIASSL